VVDYCAKIEQGEGYFKENEELKPAEKDHINDQIDRFPNDLVRTNRHALP